LIGARRGNRRLILSGRAGVYALAGVLGLSSVALVYSFLTHDYSIKYVHRYSDAASPLFYQITAYWGGLDGSILWWVFLLSVLLGDRRLFQPQSPPRAAALRRHRADGDRRLLPVRDRLSQEPVRHLPDGHPDVGKGLNPLLQNAYMVVHPPSLYTGFVGMSIPVRVRVGGPDLGPARRRLDRVGAQVDAGRRFFLSMG